MPEQFKTNVPIPPQYEPTRKRSRWWVPIVIIGVVVLFFLVVFIMIFSSISNLFEREPVVVKTNSVLVINLNRPIAEYVGESLSSLFSQDGTIAYYDLLKAIENASTDNKIKGIYLRCSASMIGWQKELNLLKPWNDLKNRESSFMPSSKLETKMIITLRYRLIKFSSQGKV